MFKPQLPLIITMFTDISELDQDQMSDLFHSFYQTKLWSPQNGLHSTNHQLTLLKSPPETHPQPQLFNKTQMLIYMFPSLLKSKEKLKPATLDQSNLNVLEFNTQLKIKLSKPETPQKLLDGIQLDLMIIQFMFIEKLKTYIIIMNKITVNYNH